MDSYEIKTLYEKSANSTTTRNKKQWILEL